MSYFLFAIAWIFFSAGGRIDHGHHDNLAVQALSETVQMSKAVKKAQDLTEPKGKGKPI